MKQLAVGRQRSVAARHAATIGEIAILLLPREADKCEEAHNEPVNVIKRFREWQRKRKEADPDTGKDWKTVGHTFRATDAVFDKTLPNRSDEGRPPH